MTSETEDRISESQLSAACAGDTEMFDAIFSQFRPELVRLIRSRIDGRLQQRFDASDVIQETYLETLQRLPDFAKRRPMPFGLWLRRTAIERFLKMRRAHVEAQRRSVQRETGQTDQSTAMLMKQLCSRDASPSENARQVERREALRQAIDQLSDEDREILLLRNVDGYPFSDIAAILQIESATARKKYGRLLMKLQRILRANEND